MPTVAADKLREIATALLRGAGASDEEAAIVSRHSIDANLAGHDSHGIIQIPTYIDRIDVGHLVPQAPFEVVRDTSTITVIDGHWGFGYTVSEKAMRMTIDKAREHGVAATTVYHQGHVGRVTDYPVMAAEAGMIGMMTADSGRSAKQVAPFGGREARLGTNPICMAMPSNLEGPLFIDIATSAVAGGKISLALARGERIPEGWIVDKDGKPTTDPAALQQGGSSLPLGGEQGHKGYGLSVMVEIFSGILTGLGFGVEPSGRHNDGVFMATFDVEAFRPAGGVQAGGDRLCDVPEGDAAGTRIQPGLLPGRAGAPDHAAQDEGGHRGGGRDVGAAARAGDQVWSGFRPRPGIGLKNIG